MSGGTVRISSSVVGRTLPRSLFRATARSMMSYAAAVSADEDIYLDDLHPGGLHALPPFIVSPEWRVMNGQPYRQALGLDDAAMWKCLHVQQDSRFLRSLRPDQTLSTEGRIQSLRQTRAGVYVAVQLRTISECDASLLADSWFCGIFLDSVLDGPDRTLSAAPELTPWQAGEHALVRPLQQIGRMLPHLYTAAADIWNPIHTERRAALDSGLSDILLHGTCTWAMAGRDLIRHYVPGNPAGLRRLAGRMAGKVAVGADLSLLHDVQPSDGDSSLCVRYQVVDAQGKVVLADGLAEFDLL
ncbi:MAG: MaoC/PaaZ C-terminal domain-containing protein [Pusillimonas sp.]